MGYQNVTHCPLSSLLVSHTMARARSVGGEHMKSFCRVRYLLKWVSRCLCLLMACGSKATDNHQGRADLGDDAPSDIIVERDSDDAIETPAPNRCSDGPLWETMCR